MTSAYERESALRPVLEGARRELAALEAERQGHDAAAHAAYVAGDVAEGDARHEKVVALRPALEAAAVKVTTLEQAADVIAADRQREDTEAQLARVTAAYEQAVNQTHRHLAEVAPAAAAARTELRQAMGYEESARRLEMQKQELEAGLGLTSITRAKANFNPVTAALESRPFWRDLLTVDL